MWGPFAVVQSLSHVWLFVTPRTTAQQISLSLTISQSLPKFMPISLVMPSSHCILWYPLLLLPSIFPSIRDFSSESAVYIRWPSYWRFPMSPSNKNSGLISLKIDWFDLLAIQGTFKSFLQHHSLKALILWQSTLLTVQLSQPCDHWEDHSFDCTNHCQQSNASVFQHTVWVCHTVWYSLK